MKKLLSSVSSVIALLWLPVAVAVAVVVSAVSAVPAFGQTQSLPNPLSEYVTIIAHPSEIYRGIGGQFDSLQFSADGRTMWVVTSDDNEVLIFTLSTGFEPSTVTGVTTLTTFGAAADRFTSLLVTPDGNRAFITNSANRRVLAYDLSTAFELSTATAAATAFFTLPAPSGRPESLAFSSDGRRMFIGENALVVAQYNLDAPFSFTGTPALERRVTLDVSLTGDQAQAYDLEFLDSGATLYVASAQSSGPLNLDPVFQFDLSTAYDFNTLNPTPSAMAPVGRINLRGIAFNPDASSIFSSQAGGDNGQTNSIAVYETVASTNLVPTFGDITTINLGYVPGAVVNVTLPAGSGGNGDLSYILRHNSGPNLAALGLTFDNSNRVLSGTVPDSAVPGDSVFPYRVHDADTRTGSNDRGDILLTITIEEDPAPAFSVASIPLQTYAQGETVSLTLPVAGGGNGALSYFLLDELGSQADLGLTFDGATRVLSGTIPISFTPANDNTFTYRVQDADTNMAATDFADLLLTLNIVANSVPAFSVASIPPQTYIQGETVSLTLPVATGGNGELSYTLINPSGSTLAELGLAFDGNVRTLTGTISDSVPLQASMFTYRVQDSDTHRDAADRDDLTLDITVVGPPPNLAATSVAFAGNLPTAEENGVAVTTLTSGQTGLTLNVEVANTAAAATAAMIQVYRSPTAVVAGSPPTVPACGGDNVRCAVGSPRDVGAFASGDATPQASAAFAAPGSNGLYHFFACFTDAAETTTLDDNCTTTIQARVGVAPTNPDVPDNGATAVRLVVPGTFDSDIGSVSDQDGFVVALVSGGTYQIDAEATSGNLDVGIALFPPGQAFFGSDCDGSDSLAANDDFGSGSDSRITYAATQTGDHLLCVYGSTITQGNYRLTAAVTVAPPVMVSFGGSGTTGAVTEDAATTTAEGTLTVTSGDGNTDVVAQTDADGEYGLFSIFANGEWTYTLGGNTDNDNAVNALAARATIDDTFTVVSAANSAATVDITITITGANDAPTVAITAPATDGMRVLFGASVTLTASGTDPDSGNTLTYEWSANPGVGTFANANAARTTWTAPDSGTDPVTLTLTVTDDAPMPATDTAQVTVNPVAVTITFGGDTTGGVTEDDATTTAEGQLTITTNSNDKDVVVQTDQPGIYGTFTITADGMWTYTLDNNNAATNALAAGATPTDTFTITASVNPTATVDVTITVTGRNDPPVAVVVINGVSGTESLSVNQGSMVTLDGSGSSDPDTGNTLTAYTWSADRGTISNPDTATADATWTAPTLAAGADDVTATLTLTVTDNNGADSAPVTVAVTVTATPAISIPGGLTASVNADGSGGTASGTLAVVNPPAPDAVVAFTPLDRVADSDGYGVFTLDAGGGWEYELDNSAGSAYERLSGAENPAPVVEFAVTATVAGFADALSATLTITVTGRDDPPVAVVMINGVAMTGESISVEEGATVTLDGSGSSDPEDQGLTYLWTQTGGETITLTPGGTDATGRAMSTDERTTFTTPPMRTDLAFTLAVTAGGVTPDPATFTVRVMNRGGFDNVHRTILPEVTRAMVDTTVSAIARRVAAESDAEAQASPGGIFNLGGRSFVIGAGGSRDVSGDAFNPDSRKNTLAEALWKNKEALAGGTFNQRALADVLWTNKEVLTGGAFGLGGQRDLLEALWANKDVLTGGARQLKSMLGRSSFALPLNQLGGPLEGITLWGNGDYRNLSGKGTGVDWDGDLFGATFGGDAHLTDTTLAGLAVSWADGAFDYTDSSGPTPAPGDYRATLVSLHPYVSTSLLDGQVTLWATAGYGRGEIEITSADDSVTADTKLVTGAVGGAGRLLTQSGVLTPDGTTTLRVKGEILTTAITAAQKSDRLAGLDADARRLRLTLEGSHDQPLPNGAQLTPSVGVGLRHDAGDGRTGTGAEVSGGLVYAYPALRLTMESRGRVLLAHGGDYEDWSVSGRVTLAPGMAGQGLAVTLAPTYQTTTSASGLAQLWEQGTANRPAPSGPTTPQGLMEATVAYGLPVGDHLLTPYGGMTMGAADARTYRLGSRVRLAQRLNMSLEGARKGATGRAPVDHGVRLELEWNW